MNNDIIYKNKYKKYKQKYLYLKYTLSQSTQLSDFKGGTLDISSISNLFMTIYNYSINNNTNLQDFITTTTSIFTRINSSNILNNNIFKDIINLIICIICKYKDSSFINIIKEFINGEITIKNFLSKIPCIHDTKLLINDLLQNEFINTTIYTITNYTKTCVMRTNTIKNSIYKKLISKGGNNYIFEDALGEDEDDGKDDGENEDDFIDALGENDIIINLDNITTSFTLLKNKDISQYLDNLCDEFDDNIFEKLLITLIILIKSLIKLKISIEILNYIENIIIFVYFLYLLEKDISLKIANSIMIIYQTLKDNKSDTHNEGFITLVKFILILITIIIPGDNTSCEIDEHIKELQENINK